MQDKKARKEALLEKLNAAQAKVREAEEQQSKLKRESDKMDEEVQGSEAASKAVQADITRLQAELEKKRVSQRRPRSSSCVRRLDKGWWLCAGGREI